MSIGPAGPVDFWLETPGAGLGTDLVPPTPAIDTPTYIFDTPGASLWAAPAPITTPDALRVEIADDTGTTLVPDLPHRRALAGSVEQDASGAVTFNIGTTDFQGETGPYVLPPIGLLDPGNIVRVWCGDRRIAESLIDSAPPVQDTAGQWVYDVNGRGSLDVLDNAVLYPEVWLAKDERAFDYGSQTSPYGGWYIRAQWHRPMSKAIRSSFRWTVKKRKWPKGWPESKARWLWTTNPDGGGSADGPAWFRSHLVLTKRTKVRMWAAGDDTLQLKVDGNVVLSAGNGGWRKARSVTLVLERGSHVIAAKVSNLPSDVPGTNRSGFAFAAGKVDAEGKVTRWLLRSVPSRWLVHRGTPPGWYPPTALRAHVIEGQGRNVQTYDNIVFTFSNTHDTSGRAWLSRRDFTIPIGATGGEVVDVVRGYGYSVAMLPGLRLGVWINRGRDLRNYVAIGKVTSSSYSSRVWSRVKTFVLTHAAYGWLGVTTQYTGLSYFYGRRETMFSAGGAKTSQDARSQSYAALRDASTPEETVDVVTNNLSGPQPFRDYDLGDIIAVPVQGQFVPARVKVISFRELTTKEVEWTTTVYPFAVPIKSGLPGPG